MIEQTNAKGKTIADMVGVSPTLVCNMRRKVSGKCGRNLQSQMSLDLQKKIMDLTVSKIADYEEKHAAIIYNTKDLATVEQSQRVVEKVRAEKMTGATNKEIAEKFQISPKTVSYWLRFGANRVNRAIYQRVCG